MEVEAYIGAEDRASHARFGPTARNAVMFGSPGIAYVYLVYGMYDCLNVVTEPDGRPAAVLVRAVEPMDGVEAIREARIAHALRRLSLAASDSRAASVLERLGDVPDARLTSGPGLVGAGFEIGRHDSGMDLLDPASPLRLEPPAPADRVVEVGTSARIGIAYAAEPWRSRPWRFFDRSSASISGSRVLHRQS